jgi:hypothetical protein
MTPEEAQKAYDEAPEVPISEERIDEIVDYATRLGPILEKAAKLRHAVEHRPPGGNKYTLVEVDVLDAIFRGEVPVGGNEFSPNKLTDLIYDLKAKLAKR